MCIIGFGVFLIKAITEWRLTIKQKDPNGDGLYKSTFYTGLIIFVIIMFIAGILTVIAAEYGVYPFWVCMIPCCLAYIVIILISLLPFINLFQKRVAKGESTRKEMLTAL